MVSFDMCQGNPGVVAFMLEAYTGSGSRSTDMFDAERAFSRMDRAGIRGCALYMLWNDCCDRDTDKAIKIMLEKPIEEIKAHINELGGRGIPFEDAEEGEQ